MDSIARFIESLSTAARSVTLTEQPIGTVALPEHDVTIKQDVHSVKESKFHVEDFCQWKNKYSGYMLELDAWLDKYLMSKEEAEEVEVSGVFPPYDWWEDFIHPENVTEGWDPNVEDFISLRGRGNFRIAAPDCWGMLEEVKTTGCKIPVDSCYSTVEALENCVKVLEDFKLMSVIYWDRECPRGSAYKCMRMQTSIQLVNGGCRIKGCLDGNWQDTLCEAGKLDVIPTHPPKVMPTEPSKQLQGDDAVPIPFPDLTIEQLDNNGSLASLAASILPLLATLLWMF